MVFELPMKKVYTLMKKRVKEKIRETKADEPLSEEHKAFALNVWKARLSHYGNQSSLFTVIGDAIRGKIRDIEELEEKLRQRKVKHTIDERTEYDAREAIASALLSLLDRVKRSGANLDVKALETEFGTTVSENMVPYVELVVSFPTKWAESLKKAKTGGTGTRRFP
ncbi:hypothetical protein HZC09_05790 [Candidatus Micrarchaeota archaeon]|nr:hypothetical protein [Candidatus Micrarchaeota archaeon]